MTEPAVGTNSGGPEKVAVVSDIHSNLHALEAVFTQCTLRNIGRFFCLGDTVGYGAYPGACLEAIRRLKCPTVLGNHDIRVCQGGSDATLNPMARAGIEYSVRSLDYASRDWLGELPEQFIDGQVTLVHASLAQPRFWRYVNDENEAERSFTTQSTAICFNGHTHVPRLFTREGSTPPKPVGREKYQLDPTGRYLVNPGSVGQPRGGDPRAQFLVYDPVDLTVEFVKVEYDITEAARGIAKAGLPGVLADRLRLGV